MRNVRFACKNKAIKTMFLALLIVFCFSSAAVSAWMPSTSFYVLVDGENIPEGTVYVDLLMPIPSNNEGYVFYNENNGIKYNISSNSEIVNYCEDGYCSYTFHIVDAESDMRLSFSTDIYVEKETYNECKELLRSFNATPLLGAGEQYYFNDKVYLGSDKEEILKEIAKTVPAEIKKYHLSVEFNDSLGRESEYDFNYCRREYKYAKMAYIDESGNVLAVSNSVKIGEKRTSNIRLHLNLSGQEFNSEIDTGPNSILVILAIVIYMIWPFIVLMIIIIIVSRIKIKKIRNSSVKKH